VRSGSRRARPSASLPLAACLLLLAGCATQRIEYRQRPLKLPGAGQSTAPDRVVRADGTIVYYRDRELRGPLQKAAEGAEGKPFQVREEQEDGSVVLRAVLPEHLLSNTFTCLVNQEYDLIWDQLLAEETRQAYEQQGQGRAEFTAFFAQNRRELAATVNRMLHGLPMSEVVTDRMGPGVTRYRLIPQVAEQFQFKSVLIGSGPQGLRLVLIR
jgi:hypothetical protein